MSMENTLVECGFTKPLVKLTISDVPHLIQSVALHTIILMVKAELDQFISGLEESGVLTYIRQFPSLFRPMFVASLTELNAGERWYIHDYSIRSTLVITLIKCNNICAHIIRKREFVEKCIVSNSNSSIFLHPRERPHKFNCIFSFNGLFYIVCGMCFLRQN